MEAFDDLEARLALPTFSMRMALEDLVVAEYLLHRALELTEERDGAVSRGVGYIRKLQDHIVTGATGEAASVQLASFALALANLLRQPEKYPLQELPNYEDEGLDAPHYQGDATEAGDASSRATDVSFEWAAKTTVSGRIPWVVCMVFLSPEVEACVRRSLRHSPNHGQVSAAVWCMTPVHSAVLWFFSGNGDAPLELKQQCAVGWKVDIDTIKSYEDDRAAPDDTINVLNVLTLTVHQWQSTRGHRLENTGRSYALQQSNGLIRTLLTEPIEFNPFNRDEIKELRDALGDIESAAVVRKDSSRSIMLHEIVKAPHMASPEGLHYALSVAFSATCAAFGSRSRNHRRAPPGPAHRKIMADAMAILRGSKLPGQLGKTASYVMMCLLDARLVGLPVSCTLRGAPDALVVVDDDAPPCPTKTSSTKNKKKRKSKSKNPPARGRAAPAEDPLDPHAQRRQAIKRSTPASDSSPEASPKKPKARRAVARPGVVNPGRRPLNGKRPAKLNSKRPVRQSLKNAREIITRYAAIGRQLEDDPELQARTDLELAADDAAVAIGGSHARDAPRGYDSLDSIESDDAFMVGEDEEEADVPLSDDDGPQVARLARRAVALESDSDLE